MDDAELTARFVAFFAVQYDQVLTDQHMEMLENSMGALKERAKTLHDIADSAHFLLIKRPIAPDEKAGALLSSVSHGMLERLTSRLQHVTWTHDELETELRSFAEDEGAKLGQILQPVRAALTGRTVSPSVFNMFETLGRDESIARLQDVIS